MELTQYLMLKRRELGLSQKELAKKLGISQTAICSFESGTYLPSFKVIRDMAQLYQVSADEILSKRVY